jgi:cell division protein FtsX
MKDAVADDGDAFMRVCRMYTTINHWGIAYTTIIHRGTILCIQQSTIGGLLHIQQSTEYYKTINRGSDAKHGVAIDSNAV